MESEVGQLAATCEEPLDKGALAPYAILSSDALQKTP